MCLARRYNSWQEVRVQVQQAAWKTETSFLFSTVREYMVDHALFARRSIGKESNATIYMDGEGW